MTEFSTEASARRWQFSLARLMTSLPWFGLAALLARETLPGGAAFEWVFLLLVVCVTWVPTCVGIGVLCGGASGGLNAFYASAWLLLFGIVTLVLACIVWWQ